MSYVKHKDINIENIILSPAIIGFKLVSRIRGRTKIEGV
jgi:hypothetical protein